MARPRHRDSCDSVLTVALRDGVIGRRKCERAGVAVVDDLDRCRVIFSDNQGCRRDPLIAHVKQRQLECFVGVLVQGIVVDGHHNRLLLHARHERQRALCVHVIADLESSVVARAVTNCDVLVPRRTARHGDRLAEHLFPLLIVRLFEVQCAGVAVVLNYDFGGRQRADMNRVQHFPHVPNIGKGHVEHLVGILVDQIIRNRHRNRLHALLIKELERTVCQDVVRSLGHTHFVRVGVHRDIVAQHLWLIRCRARHRKPRDVQFLARVAGACDGQHHRRILPQRLARQRIGVHKLQRPGVAIVQNGHIGRIGAVQINVWWTAEPPDHGTVVSVS